MIRFRNVARCAGLALALALGLASAWPAQAAKTDVIHLRNGDRTTGEIKKLERGRLQLSTDSMGTVYIEWDDILRITSPANFVIELVDGRRSVGALTESEADGQMVVRYRNRERVLAMQDVVWIDPLKLDGKVTNRWDGSFSLGLDIAKTNNNRGLTGSFDARRRAEESQLSFSGSVYSRSQDEVDDTLRATLGTQYRRLLERRWFWAAIGGLERNDELGIDLRSLLGGGYGRFLTQTNKSLWAAVGGAVVVNEQRAGDEAAENNLEGYFSTSYEYFVYDSPKTTLNAAWELFPSITDAGRVRSNLDLSFRRELVEDLFLELSAYGSWDNRPPDVGENTDYGIVTSLGYTF